jgi:hypothetical protein
MLYIILAFGKSGTTLISQTLHKSGIAMVDDENIAGGYDQGNFYEREISLNINRELLSMGNGRRDSLVFPNLSNLAFTPKQAKQIEEFIKNKELLRKDWGIKDPRMSLTYPLWEPFLPEHKLIVVYRHLDEIVCHYRRNHRWPKTAIISLAALHSWRIYNSRILEILERTSKANLILNYQRFMQNDEEMNRLNRFVGNDMRDLRNPEQYRSKCNSLSFINSADPLLSLSRNASPKRLFSQLEESRKSQIQKNN